MTAPRTPAAMTGRVTGDWFVEDSVGTVDGVRGT